VHVDRVAVAGDGRVAATEVAREAPLGARGCLGGEPWVGPAAWGDRFRIALAPAQKGALALPNRLAPDRGLGEQGEGAALRVRPQLGRLYPQRQLLAECDRPPLENPVLEVDEADRPEREGTVGHRRHVQREGEDVRIGGGQVVAQREAADLGVGGDRRRVGPDLAQLELELGDLAAAAGDEGQQRGAGDHRRRRARVERQDVG
jgi:hypothetical protein